MVRTLVTAAALAAVACGASSVTWDARPETPKGGQWHCVTYSGGSFCERSIVECKQSRRRFTQVATSNIANAAGQCTPANEVVCFTRLLSPESDPERGELQSIRAANPDSWVYYCGATRPACERSRDDVLDERVHNAEDSADVSPCEEWR